MDVTRDIARGLSALVGELAALKGDAAQWLTSPKYTVSATAYRAHAAAEAALVEARRRVRLNERQGE